MTVVCHSGDIHLLRRWRLLEPVALALASRRATMVFVSASLKEQFFHAVRSARARRVLELPARVSPMGIEFDRFAASKKTKNPRPKVVFLGRLSPVKGVDVLMRACQWLPEEADVIVAGPGSASKAPARVQIIGEVRGTARDALLASADIVVIPSLVLKDGRTEGTPMVALEAMASGAAVVASNVGGLANLADAAMLVRPGDPRELARAITDLLANDELRRSYAERALLTARQQDWSVVGSLLLPAR
jgi:glycosyltransferase involved in cell wall biosynthesis